MQISDIRLKLVNDPNDRLRAVCSITFDGEFVVRDLKVVQGSNGLFVAMPSRKLSAHCPKCGQKNHIRALFCNECGSKLPAHRTSGDAPNRTRLHSDVAHPISAPFREIIQQQIIEKYQQEKELACDPNYQPADIDAEFEDQQEMAETIIHQPTAKPIGAPTPPRRDPKFDFTDYDALIAGLRSGARLDSATQNAPPAIREKSTPSRANEQQTSRKPKSDADDPTKGSGKSRHPRKPVLAPKAPALPTNTSETVREARNTSTLNESPVRAIPFPAVPNVGKPIAPRQTIPQPAMPVAQPASSASSPDDGDLPFGAGIL